MFILNLTSYETSAMQRAMGVIDIEKSVSHALREKLKFHSIPSVTEMEERASDIADIAEQLCLSYHSNCVLVYSSTYFITFLVTELLRRGIFAYATYAPKVSLIKNTKAGITCEKSYKHTGLVSCVPASLQETDAF